MDRLLVILALLVAHAEGAAGQVEHLRGVDVLPLAVFGDDDEAVAEGLTGLEWRLLLPGCAWFS